jgi:hypothetical protein
LGQHFWLGAEILDWGSNSGHEAATSGTGQERRARGSGRLEP